MLMHSCQVKKANRTCRSVQVFRYLSGLVFFFVHRMDIQRAAIKVCGFMRSFRMLGRQLGVASSTLSRLRFLRKWNQDDSRSY